MTITLLFAAFSISTQAQTRQRPKPVHRGEKINYTRSSSSPAKAVSGPHKTASGIIIIGDSTNIRAMSSFTGAKTALAEYANVANLYAQTFEGKAKVYVMPVPLASEFYGLDVTSQWTRAQEPVIQECFNMLDQNVTGINLTETLRKHADENIYARTDHHWLPLGAYYAAQKFADVARVPFKDLSHYDAKLIRDFQGTMYKFSKDAAMKDVREDFVYYMPKGVEYTSTFIDYDLDKSHRNIVSESPEHEAPFFRTYSDGSPFAYMTFMAGDSHVVHVKTNTKSSRCLLILKDSFGNAIPGYLFFSFADIHVIDCRYFNQNIIEYVTNNGITDILFANNMGHAASSRTTEMYRKYLSN